jgi:hypothetical protein
MKQPDTLTELKNIADSFFATADAFIKAQKEQKSPIDQHLLDDGWIRHTGDVCPVHEQDIVDYITKGGTYSRFDAASLDWSGITHYKITKEYDPHAENKALYAEDAKMHENPWDLWEHCYEGFKTWLNCTDHPFWNEDTLYRRKPRPKEQPKEQIIDLANPLFKGCATNKGELFMYSHSGQAWRTSDSWFRTLKELRLATPANDHANWQPFFSSPENDAKLRELAKMVKVEVRFFSEDESLICSFHDSYNCLPISNYRITGLQEGWTDNKEDV